MSGASRWLDARNGTRNAPAATSASVKHANFLTQHLLLALRRRSAIGCVPGQGKGLKRWQFLRRFDPPDQNHEEFRAALVMRSPIPMAKLNSYRELMVWQKSMNLAERCY